MSENVLYCPECRSEYREGFSTCSDCNVPLVRRLDSETSDYLVPLAREQWFEFVAELLDRLEKQDTPYVIEAGTALELLDIASANVVQPEPWEARVWVAHSREEQAERFWKNSRPSGNRRNATGRFAALSSGRRAESRARIQPRTDRPQPGSIIALI